MKQQLTDLRNSFQRSMPVGVVKDWDLIMWAKGMFEEFDKFIDAIPEHIPLSREQAEKWQDVTGKRYLLVDDKVYYSMLIDQDSDGDFEADAVNGGYRVLISKNKSGYFVANAMDEGGNNQRERFAKSKIILLHPLL